MQIVTADAHRTTITPNATMTTLASPSLGGAFASLWQVDMPAGVEGPVHAFVTEVIWSITRGAANLTLEGSTVTLAEGDTVVLPGGVMRQFTAGAHGFSAVVTTSGPGQVVRGDGTAIGTPEWVV